MYALPQAASSDENDNANSPCGGTAGGLVSLAAGAAGDRERPLWPKARVACHICLSDSLLVASRACGLPMASHGGAFDVAECGLPPAARQGPLMNVAAAWEIETATDVVTASTHSPSRLSMEQEQEEYETCGRRFTGGPARATHDHHPFHHCNHMTPSHDRPWVEGLRPDEGSRTDIFALHRRSSWSPLLLQLFGEKICPEEQRRHQAMTDRGSRDYGPPSEFFYWTGPRTGPHYSWLVAHRPSKT